MNFELCFMIELIKFNKRIVSEQINLNKFNQEGKTTCNSMKNYIQFKEEEKIQVVQQEKKLQVVLGIFIIFEKFEVKIQLTKNFSRKSYKWCQF